MEKVMPNSLGWYILEGYPWWPVYICDVFKLRPNLHILGSGHRSILKKARDFPSDFVVVYYFGSHNFSLVVLKKGILRPWNCSQKDQFLKGHPQHLMKKKGTMDELEFALHEVEEYLSQPEDIRIPPHMVPSDLDPTLEPPPPELVPQEIDVDEDDERMDEENEEMEDVLEEEEKVKKKKKEKKKEKKKKEKEKKEKKDDRKRKSDVAVRKTSPKVAKTAKTNVKSQKPEVQKEIRDEKKEIRDEKKETREEKKPSPGNMTTEALSIILEKEIRWILVNCPFEEMTTKTVRKLLEDRLDMDLRHHKASIKEGVARVISSMEEEDVIDSTSPACEEPSLASADPVMTEKKIEAADKVMPVSSENVKKREESVVTEANGVADDIEKTKTELEAASKNLSLALDLESKIINALDSLRTLDNVDKKVLAVTSLQPKLCKLRSHKSPKISELVTFLVKKWNVEEIVPAPNSITNEEILELKTKLENSETSHDELSLCLNQLSEMPLTIDHLKMTGIARAVSKLRQHGNDKVSARAHELRQKWIKQSNDQSTDNESGPNPLKTLKALNHILDQNSEDSNGRKLHSKQLAALDQLHSMSLDTQDIIDSKVGISVSKLRKSSNEKVAKLAKKLRKKWQAEAKAKAAA